MRTYPLADIGKGSMGFLEIRGISNSRDADNAKDLLVDLELLEEGIFAARVASGEVEAELPSLEAVVGKGG
jgi:hypothetical protein